MSDQTRRRVNAAFDDDLSVAPVPAGLRAVAVRAAVAAPARRSRRPDLVALVATLLVVAIAAGVFIGTHAGRNSPSPAGSAVPPHERGMAAVAFDQARGVMVVFGGNTGVDPAVDQTWTWDGKGWMLQHPVLSPSGRSGAVMGYDPGRQQAVLFGGMEKLSQGGLRAVDDTWTWDGATWRRLHPRHQPPPGFDWGPTMQYDPISKRLLMVGSDAPAGNNAARIETWAWTGSDWTLSPGNAPTSAATLFSAGARLLLDVEPSAMVGGRFVSQTWAWDGSGWSLLNPKVTLPPGPVSGAYDPIRRQLVVLIGQDTWTWDGSTWARQHPSLEPPYAGYMVYMPSLHKVVSWGERTFGLDNGMYGWDGANWKILEPGTSFHNAPATSETGFGRLSPSEAAAIIRTAVTKTQPVLLPSTLPGGPYDAVGQAGPDAFGVGYASDLRDRLIGISIQVPNPPPGQANSSDTRVRFRSVTAEYFVYDPNAPLSSRWLMWTEPGHMDNPIQAGGVPYFLETVGLTDQEFWQVANSLQ